jgi:DNA-binding PadR family transcriptional regulator
MPKLKNKRPRPHLPQFEEEIATILEDGKELYSLEIEQAYNELIGGEVSIGSLYGTLRKLERKKYIAARWGSDLVEARNGGRRRYYKITKPGKDALYAVRERRSRLIKDAAVWQPA